jgi:hypothetical protein
MSKLPERDSSKPAEQQGVFRKFEVSRVDGSDQPGGKHHGCEYFVLDVTHDQHAKAALAAYAGACAETHPELAADMAERYALPSTIQIPLAEYEKLKADAERYRWLREVDQNLFLRMAHYGWLALDAAIDDAIKQEGGA